MKKNVGLLDRKVRAFVLAPLFVVLAVVTVLTGWSLWIAALFVVLAVVMAVTASASSCPIYSVAGMNTCDKAGVGSDESVAAA